MLRFLQCKINPFIGVANNFKTYKQQFVEYWLSWFSLVSSNHKNCVHHKRLI